ncbi:MAG: hypothetical protein COB49_01745 [Alphaproteobacteria bacterium]|nr:MAG: hypothetical protein COB49_01745 [Alphaproteobacteria bacterium]
MTLRLIVRTFHIFIIVYMACTAIMVFLELFKIVENGWMLAHYLQFLTMVGILFIIVSLMKFKRKSLN